MPTTLLIPYMYGISSVVGMQPACSGAVFDNTASGFAGRFLFYLAVMPDPPESKTDSPAGRFPFNPLNIPPNNGFDKVKHLFEAGSREALPPTTSYPLTVMTFPECAQEYADQQQVRGLKGQANALDSHRVELASKLAALFCLMDQREGPRQFLVTDEDWQLGLYALAISDRARSFCMSEALDSRRTHGTEYAKDRLIASTKAKADVDRLKAETPGKITQFFNRRKQQQQGDQFTGIQISRGVNANWRPFVYESITTMNDQGLLVCADNTGSVPTSIWLLAP